MRHHNSNKKLGREKKQRVALLRSLAISLIDYEKIETSEVKAKELRKYTEKLITLGKKGDLNSRRLLISRLGSGGDMVVKKIIDDISKRYIDRPGGYLRIIKKGKRIG